MVKRTLYMASNLSSTGPTSSLRKNVVTRFYAPACSPFIRHNSTSTRQTPDVDDSLKSVIDDEASSTRMAGDQTNLASPALSEPVTAVPSDLLIQPPPFTTEAATQAIHSIGTLQELGLAKWYTPPGILQQLLEFVHISTGFAWIASIAVATVMIRVTLFPLMLKSIRNTSKLANINPMVKEHMAKLTQANKEGDKVAAAQAQLAVQKMFKDNGVNPLMSIVPIFIQMPVFIFFYYALNAMVALPVPGMEVGGLLWFTDLTAADPRHILPLATSAMTLVNFEIGAEVGASQGTTMNPAVKMVFRGVMLLMPFFTWNFPVAIFGYWFTSSLFSLVQGFMFRNPTIRARLDLPPMPAKVTPKAPSATSTLTTGTSGGLDASTPALSGGFWKNFNETVQGMRDMKQNISDKAQAAAAKQREQEAAKPKIPSKFEEMKPKLQQRKIRQQERFASNRKRKQSYSTSSKRHFSSDRMSLSGAIASAAPESKTSATSITKSDFGLEDMKDVLLEDMTSLALDELHEHRELRKYYRKMVYELPSLVEFTREFEPPARDEILQFRYTTFFGEDHPSTSKVVLEVDIRKLGLEKVDMIKLMKLAGTRINHDTYQLKMSSERFLDPAQNKKYLSDTLDRLVTEAKDKSDTFEDIPLDRRHMKNNRKPPFPKEWNIRSNKAIQVPSTTT
ncbi:Inner membrane protein oxa1-2 [Taphrina deformans PYCC 5710]|uniref:Inner membrane protein oxa1-2 n=1 Tax=Taphrina deformans (strain PYCC 5710 / ATCC 11124 / CBS 356.35 / IMI 108563 / JCM 9778 / NBRC 8474) TaxID=1097556 RepID=R4XIF5_TAPDE|nr:Inner membrane protein oxa1-2 [Taphrina deformans PYCC 5710]|eukprot:CCG83137.1 Inner membrane protein oxa1-2 [Taphrina deformans PYCC 5710]